MEQGPSYHQLEPTVLRSISTVPTSMQSYCWSSGSLTTVSTTLSGEREVQGGRSRGEGERDEEREEEELLFVNGRLAVSFPGLIPKLGRGMRMTLRIGN